MLGGRGVSLEQGAFEAFDTAGGSFAAVVDVLGTHLCTLSAVRQRWRPLYWGRATVRILVLYLDNMCILCIWTSAAGAW
jgi:hypothetical protein